MEDLKKYIRNIPDFPKPGILFRDITTLLSNDKAFKQAIDGLAHHYKGKGIHKVVGIESRGFLTAAPVAYLLGAGLVPVRKKGKLPYKTASVSYELEYGEDTLEMHLDAVVKGEKTIIIDDLLATGGTAKATCDLVQKNGGDVVGLGFLIELADLKGREKLKGYDVFSLISF
ncbi:MAG: adenine phosphoribosyltransferase [Elusimicrobia bacterium]|nr:adenine phosphoribosyltransferase [Candidatus Obscuribacterium magneticum]MCB4755481.1 adenine phosphoribosyltransferase [Candidatus Obscuribacterium magneticum]